MIARYPAIAPRACALVAAQAVLLIAACEGYTPPTGPLSGFDFIEDSTVAPDSIVATDSTATPTQPTGQVLTLVIVSGDDEGPTESVLSQPLIVRVSNQDSVPVEAVEVHWEVIRPFPVPDAYPTFLRSGTHAASTVTDADGLTSVELRLGGSPGTWQVRASLSTRTEEPGPTVSFWVTALEMVFERLAWARDPYLRYVPDPRHPNNSYLTWDVTLTGVTFTTPFSAFGVRTGGTGPVPIEWTVRAGDATLVPLYANDLYAHTVMLTPQTEGVVVIEAASPGLPAIADTLYSAAAIVLTVGSGDGHCEEGSFVPAAVTIPVGRSVAWAVCDPDANDGWLYEDGEWSWSYAHDVTFEDGAVVWPSTTEDWHPHLRAFTAPGTYRYRCTLHSTGFDDPSGEVGIVIVE